MESHVPESLRDEQRAVEAEIRAAFRGGGRSGGVSWSESVVIDNYGSDDERAEARAQDTEKRWEDLIDDPAWDEEAGIGGFNFLDAIGFHYYIAPAMIRCTRCGSGESVCNALTIDGDFARDRIRLISETEARAIARFIRFMIAAKRAVDDDIYGSAWREAYDGYWCQWDNEPSPDGNSATA